MKAGLDRRAAIVAAAREAPQAHAAFVQATNPNTRLVNDFIEDRFARRLSRRRPQRTS